MNRSAASPTALPSIASLLPSASEICVALGLGDRLVGRSHECDFPAHLKDLPVLTGATVDSQASSREIDRQVRAQLTEGLSLYRVEEEWLQELRPDLVVTQDTCDLCAVSFTTVQESVRRLLGPEAQIVSLSPTTLDDVIEDHQRVAAAAGVATRGEELASSLRQGFDEIRRLTRDLPKKKVLMLEWIDPPMTGGHWTPEVLEIAGGDPVCGHPARPTQADSWGRLAAADPDVILIAPCGFGIPQSRRELEDLLGHPEVRDLRAVVTGQTYVVDGNHFFNRPGPRLLETARIAARILHPDVCSDLKVPADSWQPAILKE